ncbi:hypothetical protein [Paraburkholderia unamae]|uniref:Uncharacterized protein n=1 Tax=Paraburkholderia unamae TaxID=219649 RepID=A0ABX5KTK2_9BURK|nr:hypothetical protein [Paraburkholderia unamae]PVX86454.1 hypothetical protein C7402_102290 [Paraburkholderia unamae]
MPGVYKGMPRAPKWSPEEDALLTKLWGEPAALKNVEHLFPLRTEAALVARGRDLKLPDRRRSMPAQRAAQGSGARIKAILESRPATAAELAALAVCSQPTVRRFITANRAEMRIARYLPNAGDGSPTAVWAWGAGRDAKRPAPKSREELSARYYRKLKRERLDKFDQLRAQQRVRAATKAGTLVRRDPLVAALFGGAA